MMCFKKGIAICVFNVISAIASAVLIIMFYNPVTEAVKTSDLGIKLTDTIHSRVSDMFVQSGNNAISSSDMPEFFKDFLYSGTETMSQSISNITDKIVGIIISVVVFLLLILAIKLVLKLVPKFINIITNLPLIKQANHVLGAVAGIAMGLLWSLVAVYIIGVLSLIPALEFLDRQIGQSLFMSIIHTLEIGDLLF